MKKDIGESEILNQILDYLNKRGIFSFRVNNGAIFDKNINGYRKLGKFHLKGVSDIIGVLNGKILCIEVKKETGKISKEQEAFLAKIARSGGVAFVARSIEEVEENLGKA